MLRIIVTLCLAATMACGGSGIGDECESDDDCDSKLCLMSCSSACAAVKSMDLECGPKYCADPEQERAEEVNSVPCYLEED